MRRLQRVPWLAIAAVAALAFGLVPQTSFPAAAATFSLWGDATSGWGLSPTSMSSPGPLLTVSVGDTVTLDLFAADSLPHSWCVDYNRNNVCDAVGENESGVFSSPSTPLTHTFVVPNNPGLFNYGCGVHGFTPMNGPIRIVLTVRPVVSVASPSGSQDWTGGSTHDVVWTMTDPNDPVTALVAYVNYTAGGPPVPIAGPVPGTANPHRVPWTLPLVDASNVIVNITVIDPAGNKGWASQPVPTVDSTAPSVVGRVPAQGSTGISTATNVIATFDEAMNTTATASPASVALQDTVTSASVPVTYSWTAGNTVLTLDPISNLAPNRLYTAVVNQTAKDASDPGNPLSAVTMWSFTTGSGADLTKPSVLGVAANPSPQEWGLATNVTASITDDDRVASAWAVVTYPDSSITNRSMA
ncbi:MAG TPA: Ig-like domain-containing protein, partial [Thermoplasmata archaeon]|nr:Ig-like domain-containing protein [Thermoplasmata archaeon]